MFAARRKLLASAGAGAVLALVGGRTAQALDRISQPNDPGDKTFIARAFEMKRLASESGDQGYGAIVVKAGRIVGQAPSRVVVNGDPTAHAEIEAIRDAARRMGTRDLRGAVMYASSHPCPMCEAAAYWANLERLHFGPDGADSGPPLLTRC